MNSELQPGSALLDERTDILFREIELATHWERPAILFAIYRTDAVRTQVMEALEKKLTGIEQKVHFLTLTDKAQVKDLEDDRKLAEFSQSVLFLDGLKNEADHVRARTFEQINKYREYFIDHSLRAVFWLLEADVQRFAARATECWYLRHRVIDFTEEIKPSKLFLNTIESCMQMQEGQGGACLKDGQLDMEVESLSEELEEQPSHGTVLYILGQLWLKKNDTRNALKFLLAALEIGDSTEDEKLQGRCLLALAKIAVGQGNNTEALEYYRKALPFSLKPAETWKNIARLLEGSGDHQGIVDALLNSLRLSPQDEAAWILLGDTYMDLAQGDQAESAYENALELAPDSEPAWLGLAGAHLQQSQSEQAVTAFQKALQLSPDKPSTWSGLGQAYLLQRRESDALLAFERAASMGSEDASLWQQLGRLYLQQRKVEHAITTLNKAVQLSPSSGAAYRDLGLAEFDKGNYERAGSCFENAIALLDDRLERAFVWRHLAETCRKLDQEKMADAAFQQSCALSETPTPAVADPIVLETPALEFLQKKQEIGGITMIESSSTFESRTAKEWNDLGNSYLKAGGYKKAVFAFTKAIEMATENNWPYIKNLAVANYKLGKRLGKRLPDQVDNPDMWEADDDEDDEITYTVQDNLPESRRYEQPPMETVEVNAPSLPENDGSMDPAPVEAVAVPTPQAPPPNAEDLNEWGNNFAVSGDFDRAVEAYKQSIQANPNYGQPYANLGFLYFKRGDYRLATILYQKGIEYLNASEEKATTLNRLGDAYHHLHRYDDAFLAYKKARELAPSRNPILDRARISVLQNSIR